MMEGKELSPAVECILISQSTCRSLDDKIKAIRERLDAHSDKELAAGEYEWHNKDFRKRAEQYLLYLTIALNCLKVAHDGTVFVIENENSPYDGAIFDNWDDAFKIARSTAEPDEYYRISERVRNSLRCLNRYNINPQDEIYGIDVYNMQHEEELHHAFAEIPHNYKIGDIISYGNKYAVITELTTYKNKARTKPLDDSDMSFYAMQFGSLDFHSCGGAFGHIQVPILKAEMADLSDYPGCPKPLRMLSNVLTGKMSIPDFIELYSNKVDINEKWL